MIVRHYIFRQITKTKTHGLYKKLDPFIVFSYIKEIQKRNIDTGRGSERDGGSGFGAGRWPGGRHKKGKWKRQEERQTVRGDRSNRQRTDEGGRKQDTAVRSGPVRSGPVPPSLPQHLLLHLLLIRNKWSSSSANTHQKLSCFRRQT